MTERVKLTTHLGTDIFVDDQVGKFWATLSNGRDTEERTLAAIKKQIENDEPNAIVMNIKSSFVNAHKDAIKRGRAQHLMRNGHTRETGNIFGYMELDMEIIVRLEVLTGEEQDELMAVRELYQQRRRDVLNKGIPLTAERLIELLEEDAQRKAARR